MKKVIFLSLIISLIIGSCAKQEVKSPIEGAWRMVYVKMASTGFTLPGQISGAQIKMWSKEHYVFNGHFKLDTATIDNYGWGTYKLNGNNYEEYVTLHASKSSIGSTVRMILEIRTDTLTYSYPTDENWKLPEKYNIEKYVRVK
jgi:hypothetical protein